MRLVYCVISCDGLGGSIACASNSQMASTLSQIRVACSAMKMSSLPLECTGHEKLYIRFLQQWRTRDRRNPRRLPYFCFAQISPLLWSFSRFWSIFIGIEVSNEVEYSCLLFSQESKRAGFLNPRIWLANHAHATGPAFYDTTHGPHFFSRSTLYLYFAIESWAVIVSLLCEDLGHSILPLGK